MQKPKISIICNAYNHEKYIADALDSFLMQKVNVPFEILVHDDASTDKTAEIIRSYEEKYPDIIKPIYQIENQYSKYGTVTYRFQLPRAQGKYIAFCEGDDYWTDPHKLQIQYDFMEQNTDYSVCCHAYNMVDTDKNLIQICEDFPADCVVPMERLLGNQLKVPHFATLFIRREYIENLDGSFLGVTCNDMILRIYCAIQADIYYINRNMSAYRRFVEGSWTMRVGKKTDLMIQSQKKYLPFFEKLNEYTDGKYDRIIHAQIDDRLFQIDLLEQNYKAAKHRKAYNKASFKRKCYILIGCAFPTLINKMRDLRSK